MAREGHRIYRSNLGGRARKIIRRGELLPCAGVYTTYPYGVVTTLMSQQKEAYET
jgi:hypothetical protein